MGAGLAANVLGIPAVAYAIGLTHMGYAMIHPAAIGYHRTLWTDRGQQPPDGTQFLADALLDPTPASLRRFNGPFDVPEDSDPAGRVRGVDRRRARLARRTRRPGPGSISTLGTVSFGAVEVLQRALGETADLDVDILVTVGPEGDPAALGKVGPGAPREVRQPDRDLVPGRPDRASRRYRHGARSTRSRDPAVDLAAGR